MNDCGKCVFEDRSCIESPCRECLDMAVYQDIENACFRPVNEEEEDGDEK